MNDKLNVLYITRKYPPMVGGMENFSYFLYNGFDEKDINKKIIALGKSQINLLWFYPFSLFYAIITVKKWDVVFIGDSVLCGIGYFVKLISPKTIIVTNVYGLDITYANPIYQFYLKLFYNKYDKYICISNETDILFKKRGGKRSVVITPGVDINKFLNIKENREKFKSKYNIPNENLVLITVGRLVKRKGVAWFIDNVMSSFKGKNITYLIIGDGEDKNLIKSLTDKHCLNDEVKLLGRISDEDLNELYVNSDVFIMPNIVVENDMEGFGIVAIEASLAGLIVIASGIEGIKDAVSNMKNGILVESQNAQDYIRTIYDIMINREKYNKLSLEFRNYTRNLFSWNNICKKYVEIFKELVK